jgi:hypothetical protein
MSIWRCGRSFRSRTATSRMTEVFRWIPPPQTPRSSPPGCGKLILALVCLAAFLDVIDTTIVNVALPSIRAHIHFTVPSPQWIASGG